MEISEFKNIIWDYTRKIEESANTALGNMGAIHGLTAMQLRILMEVNRKDCCTIGGLAENVCIAGTNLSTMCKKLEKQGYLERKRDIKDERVVRISLTIMGRNVVCGLDEYFTRGISRNISKECFENIIFGMECLNNLLKEMGSLTKEEEIK